MFPHDIKNLRRHYIHKIRRVCVITVSYPTLKVLEHSTESFIVRVSEAANWGFLSPLSIASLGRVVVGLAGRTAIIYGLFNFLRAWTLFQSKVATQSSIASPRASFRTNLCIIQCVGRWHCPLLLPKDTKIFSYLQILRKNPHFFYLCVSLEIVPLNSMDTARSKSWRCLMADYRRQSYQLEDTHNLSDLVVRFGAFCVVHPNFSYTVTPEHNISKAIFMTDWKLRYGYGWCYHDFITQN